jgi:hypothetical protein
MAGTTVVDQYGIWKSKMKMLSNILISSINSCYDVGNTAGLSTTWSRFNSLSSIASILSGLANKIGNMS